MLKVVTTEEMQRIEKAADAGGLTYDEMMANAGASIADAILERWPEMQDVRVLILVGPGNNGGDGLVVGHHLLEVGAEVEVYLSNSRSAADDHNFARLDEAGVEITLAKNDPGSAHLVSTLKDAEIIVDALLGTGIKLPLRGAPRDILSAVKATIDGLDAKPYVVAVDCPSGLDCDSGKIAEESLSADLTVTLAAAKPGLFGFPGAGFVGELVVGSIGLKSDQSELEVVEHIFVDSSLVSSWLPERPINAHKGTFGRVIVVAGSINYPGAAALAAMGAYRSGAGLVTLAVPSVIQAFLVPGLSEATWIALPHEMGVISKSAVEVLLKEMSQTDAILLGPGFGRDPVTKAFLDELLHIGREERTKKIGFLGGEGETRKVELPPAVIDADGLSLISEIPGWYERLKQWAVLTPHPGEFALMTGLSVSEVQDDRTGHAREYAEKWGHVIVLKGAYTVIADPDGRVATIPIATPALATAGTGDVLSGIILSLRGQGLPAFEAAVVGAFLHARAGEFAALEMGSEIGVVAGDIAEMLPEVFRRLDR